MMAGSRERTDECMGLDVRGNLRVGTRDVAHWGTTEFGNAA